MFDHPDFDKIEYHELPIERDVYLYDEMFLTDYESMMLRFFEGEPYENIGKITDVSIISIEDDYLQIQWAANIFDRFHTIEVKLPRINIVGITACWRSGEKVRIFVSSDWINNLHNRRNCIFALIDAAGMKNAILSGAITRQKLVMLRDGIDLIAEKHKSVSFISFADTIILKYVWGKSIASDGIDYAYTPEYVIEVSFEVCQLFMTHFGLKSYAVLTQGINEFYEDDPLHISNSMNHISLNSFGTPFAQLIEIESFARQAIRKSTHKPADLYFDERLFASLKFSDHNIKSQVQKFSYDSKISNSLGWYYPVSFEFMADCLKSTKLTRH